MSVWGKLFTAVRGGANEAGEAIVDSQAMRILDQELRDAENALRKARGDLAGMMATAKRIEKRVEATKAKEARDIENARGAMDAGREDLARAVAERVATSRAELQRDEADLAQMQQKQAIMLRTVKETEQRIAAMKREVESVKATESLQKAQKSIASSHAGVNSRLGSAMGSLDRIKDRQEQMAARLEAGEEMAAMESGADLDRQLLEAGIGGRTSSADSILAEIAGPSKSSAALPSPGKSPADDILAELSSSKTALPKE
ncbi:transcriptional regulator [Novosphingobium sp. PC22D]|uniref:PspA/IM30 family protein n=1 Tax=Novosphingobium sp. PC22D TaxID=1962403 RepID=UPI000BF1DA45|nr:PspA/IM30 family protein [Novosphingobium sp. PC22D]PEQ14407.1 transcriptional regulator [Novosphingobium sp. PC22D]